MQMIFGKVKISETGVSDEVEFRLDDYVAYGTFEHSEHGLPVYSVDHGPTQGDVDAIASALDEAFDAVECTSEDCCPPPDDERQLFLRWSDRVSFAIPFEPTCAASIVVLLEKFRETKPTGIAELHVLAPPFYWLPIDGQAGHIVDGMPGRPFRVTPNGLIADAVTNIRDVDLEQILQSAKKTRDMWGTNFDCDCSEFALQGCTALLRYDLAENIKRITDDDLICGPIREAAYACGLGADYERAYA